MNYEFVELCRSSKDIPYWAFYNDKWNRCQHCSCEVCERELKKYNLKQCVDKSCEACREQYAF